MGTRVTSYWNRMVNLGIDPETSGREVIRIRLLNQLAAVSLLTSLLAMISYLIFWEGPTIIFTTSANISAELLVIYLAYRRRHFANRLFATFGFATLVAFHVVLLDKNFGEANIFTGIALTAFFLLEGNRRLQMGAVAYISLLYIGSALISRSLAGPAAPDTNPYDELLTFPMVMIVLGIIIFLYQQELRRYEKQKSQLINDLAKKNTALAQTNSELEDFTYLASHDLKTPLRTVSNYLDLIERKLQQDDLTGVTPFMQFAKQGTKQMYALINDILEYKQISEQETERKVIDLHDVLQEAWQHLAFMAHETGAQLNTSQLPAVRASRTDFLLLLQNLLENAMKYNEQPPRIRVWTSLAGQEWQLHMTDNGIGIAPEYRTKIFQFFSRLHTRDEFEGTGIGLAICKKIVEKHQGSISVLSNEPQGSHFLIQFPTSLLAAEAATEAVGHREASLPLTAPSVPSRS